MPSPGVACAARRTMAPDGRRVRLYPRPSTARGERLSSRPTAAAKPNVRVTRIRTLRGNSGGVVYLRREVPTDDRVVGPDDQVAGGSDQDLAQNR